MAHNEEANIVSLLESLLSQSVIYRVSRVVVVASGCTDQTCGLVESVSRRDPRVTLISEPLRSGKIAAINTFLEIAREPVVVVSCGDVIFEPGSLERLLAPLDAVNVGMTGAHPIPVNGTDTFSGLAVTLMWDLHHRIALRRPKMGEVVAFKNIFESLNTEALCDELSIEEKIRNAGLGVVYAADARVRNKGPATLSEFLRQRIRWTVANLQIVNDHHMKIPTMNLGMILTALRESLRENRFTKRFVIMMAVMEIYCRCRAYLDYYVFRRHQKHRIWDQLSSTKTPSVSPIAPTNT